MQPFRLADRPNVLFPGDLVIDIDVVVFGSLCRSVGYFLGFEPEA